MTSLRFVMGYHTCAVCVYVHGACVRTWSVCGCVGGVGEWCVGVCVWLITGLGFSFSLWSYPFVVCVGMKMCKWYTRGG